MERAGRLLDIIQFLRRHRRPVSAQALGEAFGVSIRTIYRDIAVLGGQGVPVRGEAGIGYVLEAGFDLPPLMFNADEIEAVLLGLRLVRGRGDADLRLAAENVVAKIAAVLPSALKPLLLDGGLYASPFDDAEAEGAVDEADIRAAIRQERKCALRYRDREGDASRRVIWPFGLAYFNKARIIMAWCELRRDFRHFRTDRADALEILPARYPRRRAALYKTWQEEVMPRNPEITKPETSG